MSFHGAAGQLANEPMLGAIALTLRGVRWPIWPGYSEQGGEEKLEDVQDSRCTAPTSSRHSACTSRTSSVIRWAAWSPPRWPPPRGALRQARADRAARSLARRPPDHRHLLAASLEFPPLLFHDAAAGTTLMAGGLDFNDAEAIKTFLIANNRRLGTAGKVLFPIPDRRVAKRLYRITNPTLLVWGDDDRYVPQPYAEAWRGRDRRCGARDHPRCGAHGALRAAGRRGRSDRAILRGVTRENTAELPVVISGGGLVGLSTAMFLAQHGVPSLVVERLRGGSPLPRAAHFHLRTIELFRSRASKTR